MNKAAAFLSMFSQHFQHDAEKTRDKQALVFPNMIVQYKYLRKMSVLSNVSPGVCLRCLSSGSGKDII